jgi:hypothetical protein
VKSFIVIAAFTSCVLVLSACDSGGDGTLESCATALVGGFEGDQAGVIHARLTFEGTLQVLFAPENDGTSRDATVTVAADSGEITPGGGALQLTGAIDFNTCEGSGDWSLFGVDTGTWHIELRKHTGF